MESRHEEESKSATAVNNTPATVTHSNWWYSLHKTIAADLDILLEDYQPVEIVSALNKFIAGASDYLTENHDFNHTITNIFDLLTLFTPAAKLYQAITQHEQKENQRKKKAKQAETPLPTIDEVKTTALSILKELCKERNVIISDNTLLAKDLPDFMPGKQYVYEEIFAILNAHFATFKMNIPEEQQGKMLINLLTHFADADDVSWKAVIASPQKTEQSRSRIPGMGLAIILHTTTPMNGFYVDLSTSFKNFEKFSRYCNKETLENDAIERLTDSSVGLKYAIQVRIKPIVKLLLSDKFKQSLANFLSDPAVLENFRLFLDPQQQHLHNAFTETINTMGEKYRLNIYSDILESSLLHAFGIQSEYKVMQFQPATRHDSFMTCADFYLDITTQDAHQLEAAINQEFPNSAKLIQENAKLEDRDPINLQLISIKYETLNNPEFLKKLSTALENIRRDKPTLFKKLLLDSSSQYFEELNEDYKAYPELYKALENLIKAIQFHKPQHKIDDASFDVERAIANEEAARISQGRAAYNAFKIHIKNPIKHLQKEVGLRTEKENALNDIAAEEKMDVQSKLQALSQQCHDKHPALATALTEFSSTTLTPDTPNPEQKKWDAVAPVRKAIASIEAACSTRHEHTLFKRGIKKEIKALLKAEERQNTQPAKP